MCPNPLLFVAFSLFNDCLLEVVCLCRQDMTFFRVVLHFRASIAWHVQCHVSFASLAPLSVAEFTSLRRAEYTWKSSSVITLRLLHTVLHLRISLNTCMIYYPSASSYTQCSRWQWWTSFARMCASESSQQIQRVDPCLAIYWSRLELFSVVVFFSNTYFFCFVLSQNTRVIIFSSIRASVSSIYKMLHAAMANFGRAGVRVGEFTGKSTASGGSKGQTSKGQQVRMLSARCFY